MQISEVLNKAADHIERYGHHKGKGFGGGGHSSVSPACTIGAIAVASSGGRKSMMNRAADAISAYLGNTIVAWNDAPERTAAEVVEALRAAALIEAAKEAPAPTIVTREHAATLTGEARRALEGTLAPLAAIEAGMAAEAGE